MELNFIAQCGKCDNATSALSQDLQSDDPRLPNPQLCQSHYCLSSGKDKAESKNPQKEDAPLRAAHPAQSEYCLSTVNDFVKIKLSKESPAEIEKALKIADDFNSPLPSARPSEAEITMTDTHRLVVNMPDVQAFNEAEERRSIREKTKQEQSIAT